MMGKKDLRLSGEPKTKENTWDKQMYNEKKDKWLRNIKENG